MGNRAGGGDDMIYWSSTKSPVHLFKREYECEETAKHVIENACVDPSILVADLGINHMAIKAYQRRLGVRALAENNPVPKQMWGGRARAKEIA